MRNLFRETRVPRIVGGTIERELSVVFRDKGGLERTKKAFGLHVRQVTDYHPWKRDVRTNERVVSGRRQDLQGEGVYIRVHPYGEREYALNIRGQISVVEAISDFIKKMAKIENERTIQLMELESRLPKEGAMGHRARNYILEESGSKTVRLDLTDFDSAASFKRLIDKFGLKPSVESKSHPFLKDQPTRKVFWWKGPGLAIATTNNPITGEYTVASQRENEKGYAGYVTIEGDSGKVKAARAMIKKLASTKGE